MTLGELKSALKDAGVAGATGALAGFVALFVVVVFFLEEAAAVVLFFFSAI